MSEKLKSCPFCGEIPHNDRLSGITDCKCGACFMLRNIGLHWNSRPEEDALLARIGKLEDALKEISISGRIRNNDKQFQKRIETIIEEVLKGAVK